MDDLKSLFSARDIESLQQESHTPLYYQMYSLLKKSIANGTLAYGNQLPTEYQLADAFSVSRITAKRALDDLAAENWVERRRGKGTHVIYQYESPITSQPPIIDDLHDLETIARQTDVSVIEASLLQAPANIQSEFSLSPDEALFHTIRVRSKNGSPFARYTSWTKGLNPLPTREQLSSHPRIELLRSFGIRFAKIEQTLSAVLATKAIATELDIEEGQPLLSLTRHSYLSNGDLVDRLDGLYHPERFHYKVNIESKEKPTTQKERELLEVSC